MEERERMKAIRTLFPEGKNKALTFSYDDAQIHDRKLVNILNQYHMKGTFHLNGSTLGTEGFIAKEEVKELYKGHEVACHGMTHPFFNKLSQGQTAEEIYLDRKTLEECTGGIVRGMSYPYGEYNDELIRTAKSLGIVYSRTVEGTMKFYFPADFMKWHPTCHHEKVTDAMMEDFLNQPEKRTPALFYIWGHSFEFERKNNWDIITHICEKLQGREDVWYATNIEIYEYVTAMRSLVTSVDGERLYNPTCVPLWIRIDDTVVKLLPGKEVSRRTCCEIQ